MGVIAEGIFRGCQGLFTPVSLGYPLSVFNKNSTLKVRKQKKFSTISTGLNKESSGCPNDCAAVRRLGNWGCSKKSTKNKLVNRSSDKQSESVNVPPKRMANTRLASEDPRTCPGPGDRRVASSLPQR